MKEKTLRAYAWAKNVFGVICLLCLGALSLFSVIVHPYDIINATANQATRAQFISKDALLLEYTPASQLTTRTTAISELQDILPNFQQEEAYLSTLKASNVKLLMLRVSQDYTPMDVALKALLASPTKTDPIQVGIILQHEKTYTLGINQVVAAMLQDLDDIQQQIFVIDLVLFSLLILLAGMDSALMERHTRAVSSSGSRAS